MIGDKVYCLIVLANHKPSKWALETAHEYFGGKSYFKCSIHRVTNNYSLKFNKRKFKFTDLPCLHVTECVAKGKYKKELYYGDDIEIQCKEGARKEMRRESRLIQRESASSLRLRVHKDKQKFRRDVLPAPQEHPKHTGTVSTVHKGKKERD